MENHLYPHLFAPIRLSGVQLPNRVLMGSMHVGMEEDADYTNFAAYFAARARGGVGLIVTGGIAPNRAGWVKPFAARMASPAHAKKHRTVTDAVHAEGGRIAMQILHAGRYAYHPFAVAPSRLKSPISPFTPWALSSPGVEGQIADFVRSAVLARDAGYDGVEVMGSEGYLINEFISATTNLRKDAWGGSYENRIRFPIEIVRRTREAVGPDFAIIYRLSMLDLVPEGSTWDEVVHLAKAIEAAGASALNTGIGWHEARVPTIATLVPRGAFTWVTRKLKGQVGIPLITSNRINTPDFAESVIARGDADLVSMARPLLADPDFVRKASAGQASRINTCIACNQACLDHIFKNQRCSCLVNPRACRETEFPNSPVASAKTVAVVGAGPAGLACATEAAARGHTVTLFDAHPTIGGQFNLARRIPGKEEFSETLRYFTNRLADTGVTERLATLATTEDLAAFNVVVLATGISPRKVNFPGSDNPHVHTYTDVIEGRATIGKRVAIIGAGGIGFDVAEFLTSEHRADTGTPQTITNQQGLGAFLAEWGVDATHQTRGGLIPAHQPPPPREVWLLQRSKDKLGGKLGKTTGWIHRAALKNRGVHMLSAVSYERFDDAGLHITVNGKPQVLPVDDVVVCAGQEPKADLLEPLKARGIAVHIVGGARLAGELDAKRAIAEGTAAALAI